MILKAVLALSMSSLISFNLLASSSFTSNLAFSDPSNGAWEADSKTFHFLNNHCQISPVENGHKSYFNYFLDKPLSAEQIAETSGILFQGMPTPRAYKSNDLSSFFNDTTSLDVNIHHSSAEYFYMAENVVEASDYTSDNCTDEGFITRIEKGNRAIFKVEIYSSVSDDINLVTQLFQKQNVGFFSIAKTLKTLPKEVQNRIGLQFGWHLQTPNYSVLLERTQFLMSKLGLGNCFIVEAGENSCENKIFSTLSSFIFDKENNFLSNTTLPENTTNQSILRVGFNENFKYTPAKEIVDLYNEKIANQKLLDLLSVSNIFYIDYKDLNGERRYNAWVNEGTNASTINDALRNCFEAASEEDCTASYERYVESREGLYLDPREIKLEKGFIFYCQESEQGTEEYLTASLIKEKFGIENCLDEESLISSIGNLDLSNSNIKSLKPLLGLRNIRVLKLQNNYIEDFKVLESFSRLASLDLSYNKIKVLTPFKTKATLDMLNLKGNLFSTEPSDLERYETYFPMRNGQIPLFTEK